MEPDKIAALINEQVIKAVSAVANKTFYRGVISAIKGRTVDVFIEGNTTAIPNIACLDGYNPAVGHKVLVLSIGLSGTNFLVVDKIDDTGLVINLITNPSAETNGNNFEVYDGIGGPSADMSAPFGNDVFWLMNMMGGYASYTTGNLIAGKTYTFSAYIKDTGGYTEMMGFHNATQVFITSAATTTWQRVNFTFTATANAPLYIDFGVVGSDHSMYIDGLMLTEGSTLHPYFDGSVASSGVSGQAWDGTAHQSTSRAYIPNTDNTWITPSPLTNSWVTYDADPGGWSAPGYMRDHNGFVHLRGLMKNGTVGSAMFTLPAGYRPTGGDLLISTISNGAVGRIKIGTNGQVVPESPSSNAWVALDGITFKADDSGL